MNSKIIAVALFGLTLGLVVYYPTIQAKNIPTVDPVDVVAITQDQPVIDVVFVLDTTGSMSGLIQTAKDKIWSIATTMASAQPTPRVRIGLVAYRDRGDAYVTRRVDLSDDLDSVYAALMDFAADGGGDAPEAVNAGLSVAINQMSWEQNAQAYRAVFLVGDAPPHTDYQDELQFPQIIAQARQKGIVVNAIQCGEMQETMAPWNSIAKLGGGDYFQVEQAGGAVAYTTPFDSELAELTARLDATRLYYGSDDERAEMAAKKSATDKLNSLASDEAKARRGVFNMSAGGRKNLLGKKELVAAVTDGDVALESIAAEELPATMRAMAPEEQQAHLDKLVQEREEVRDRMRELAESRQAFISKKVEEDGGAKDSLDQKLYETIRSQAAEADLELADGPAY